MPLIVPIIKLSAVFTKIFKKILAFKADIGKFKIFLLNAQVVKLVDTYV